MNVAKSARIVIPIASLKSGVFHYNRKNEDKKERVGEAGEPDCSMIYEEGSSMLYFNTLDQKHLKKCGEKKHVTLECTDITAIDLNVSTKHGCWDSIASRILVECFDPVVSWRLVRVQDIEGLAERRLTEEEYSNNTKPTKDSCNINKTPRVKNDGTATDECQYEEIRTTEEGSENKTKNEEIAYIRHVEESCMVKATFDIEHLSKVRDLLHSLKVNKLRNRKLIIQSQKQGKETTTPIPSKIREGLPAWVNYIPAKYYSCTVRQVLEYMLMIYTILTLVWAIWQLYKHVGFIRQFLRPIMDFVDYYFEKFRHWFRWTDKWVGVITNYWWMYMKPLYMIFIPVYSGLAYMFKPLRNIAAMFSALTQPFVAVYRVLVKSLGPLLNPFLAGFYVLLEVLKHVIGALTRFSNSIANSLIVRMVLNNVNQLGFRRLVHQVSDSSIDSLKVHFVVVQNVLVRSTKQVRKGFSFFLKNIRYINVFVKREKNYNKEESTSKKTEEEASKEKKDETSKEKKE